MSIGVGVVANIGAGTRAANAASATILPVGGTALAQSGSNAAYVLFAYITGQDPNQCRDIGDGWVFLDRFWDAGTGCGALLAVCGVKPVGYTWQGIALPGNAAWTCQGYGIAVRHSGSTGANTPTRVGFEQGCGSVGGILTAASSTTINVPGILPNYAQWIDVVGVGYNNGGVTTTVTMPFAEVFDTGQAAPPHGVALSYGTVGTLPRASHQFFPATTATLAVAKTNKIGLRCCLPVFTNVNASAFRHRYMSARRVG